jgi:hypothetical protein
MKSLCHLTSAGTLQAFIATILLQTLILFLPLAIGKNFIRLPEPGSINRLNTGSYGITVTL